MADSSIKGLLPGALVADSAIPIQNTDASTRAERVSYAKMGGLVLASDPITGSNLTATPGTLHQLTIAGLTANRDFILPDTAAVGERIGLYVVDGDDGFEVEIKTAAAGSTINGTDYSTNEWSRVFIKSETMLFRCTVAGGAGATEWIIEPGGDGRIPCKASISRSGSDTATTAGALREVFCDTSNYDVGGVGSTASVTMRRSGFVSVSASIMAAASIPDQKWYRLFIGKNGTGTQVSRTTIMAGKSFSSYEINTQKLRESVSPGDYFKFYYAGDSTCGVLGGSANNHLEVLELFE